MSKWEFTINTEVLYLNAESENKELLKDIEEAVKKVLREAYPDMRFDYNE